MLENSNVISFEQNDYKCVHEWYCYRLIFFILSFDTNPSFQVVKIEEI